MTKKALIRKLAIFLFFATWLGWIITVGNYVQKYFSDTVQVQGVHLITPVHESAELPIYSKFYVTQTVSLSQPLEISRIVIPIHQPDGATNKIISSVQNDMGETAGNEFEVTGATKELIIPINFAKPSKSLTILLSASDVSWKVADTEAPRIYREKSLRGYREGKMTIAGIDKEGNIGLSVFATYTRVNFMRKQYGENHKVVSAWLRDGLLVFLALVWPSVFFDFLFNKKQQKNGKNSSQDKGDKKDRRTGVFVQN